MPDRKIFYGAYFYPPLFFKGIPPSFMEMFAQIIPPYVPIEKPVLNFPFLNYEVSMDSAGFIWTDQTEKEVSEAILNSIFLSATLLKYAVRSVNQKELTSVSIDQTTNEAYTLNVEIVNERGWLHSFPEMRTEFLRKEKPVILTQDEFKVILELAEKIFLSKFKTTILTFYECYTIFDRGNVTVSFLFGWITIESFINHVLEEHLVSKGESIKYVDQCKKTWKSVEKIDFLDNESALKPPIKAADLHKLRKIRNKILHKELKATEGESIDCKDLATAAMWELFRMESGIEYGVYYNKMKSLSQQK